MPGDGCDETCQVECPVDGLFDPMTHHCYVYLPSGMSWSSARTSCLALGPGVDLAALSSAAELSFVEVWTPVATRLSNGLNVWLGGEETAVENVFVWTNGEPFDDSLWNLDEPNNSGMVDEECVDLRRKNGTNGLNDDECIAVAHVLCERTPAGT